MEDSAADLDQKNSAAQAADSRKCRGSREEGITRQGLHNRGWTDASIEAFLGSPDWTIPNPYYGGVVPTRVWDRKRVERIEKTDEWHRWRQDREPSERSPERRDAANDDAVATIIESVSVNLPDLDREELIQRAVDAYNEVWAKREQQPKWPQPLREVFQRKRATANDDMAFLKRLVVNHLRHNETDYDGLVKCLTGKVGEAEAKYRLRRRIYTAIAAKYPWLADEVRRKLREIAEERR